MIINGCDCSIVIKTAYRETGIPYAEETLREAVSFLTEEAAIEGDGHCGGIKVCSGFTGCVVTPLSIGTAPLLLYLAMGSSGLPVFVSETRNLYRYGLDLAPMEDGPRFTLIQGRGDIRRQFEGCNIQGFELRIHRGEVVKLKLEITGEAAPSVYPYTDQFETIAGERFSGDGVTYRINGTEYKTIYGLTLSAKKEGGTKTELWIKRSLESGPDIPDVIEELTITAQLYRDIYEYRHYGAFRITLKRLVMIADETAVDCADAVIGPLRYYVAGVVTAEVFNDCGGSLE